MGATTTTIRGLAAATVLAFARLGAAAAAATNGEPGATHLEAPAIRSFFYAGGGYADDGAGGHVFRDQMYVEHLRPPGHPGKSVKDTPVVLIHGQAQTGTVCYFFPSLCLCLSLAPSLSLSLSLTLIHSPTQSCAYTNTARLLPSQRVH